MKQRFSRIIETEIQASLQELGGLVIEGPKLTGKTFLGQKYSKSQFYTQNYGASASAFLLQPEPNLIFDGPKPRLIDEWQLVPQIWDRTRWLIDYADGQPGLYILTGSNNGSYHLVNHSGAGRFAWLTLATLTFAELLQNDQKPKISLEDLFKKQIKIGGIVNHYSLNWVVEQLIQGGWPGPLSHEISSQRMLDNYLNSLSRINDTYYNHFRLSPQISIPILKSLSRLNGNQIKLSTILADLDHVIDRATLIKYLLYFKTLFLTFELTVWNPTYRVNSKRKIRTTPKTYLCDPSIGAHLLQIQNVQHFFQDLNLLGFYFENQVIKDLLVYAQALNGKLYFYRDDKGFEIDAIMELSTGQWAAFEIKVGVAEAKIEQAAQNLLKFAKLINEKTTFKEPAFLMIITAGDHLVHGYCRPDGIYVVPHTCLTPFVIN